jgi:hypothetical protein
MAANASFLRSLRAHLEVGWEELRGRAGKTLPAALACAAVAIVFLVLLPSARSLGWMGFLLAGGLYLILAGGLVALVHPSLLGALKRAAV